MNMVFKPGAPADASPPRPATPPIINGKGLKHRRGTVHQRAHLAADGGMALLRPSIEQACLLFAVPRQVLSKHLHARNGNGKRRPKPVTGESLVDHLMRSTPVERLEAARALGPEVVWDEMVLPLIAIERAAAE